MKVELQPEDIQAVLGELLVNPTPIPMDLTRRALPERSAPEHLEALLAVKKLTEKVLSSTLKKGQYQPILLDRLSFAWIVLRQAETCIKNYKGELPRILQAENLKEIFGELLPIVPQECFIQKVCEALGLGADGKYIRVFKETIIPKKPKKLNLQFVDKHGEVNWENVDRLIIWMIRRRRDRYVDVDEDGAAKVEFPYLISEILKEVPIWTGIQFPDVDALKERIEDQINCWLDYSCIQGEIKLNDETVKDVVRTFSKLNLLNTKVFVPDVYIDPHVEDRIRELEKLCDKYAEENRILEDQNKTLNEEISHLKQRIPKDREESRPSGKVKESSETPGEIRDLLKIIDSKYSFDVLQEIQLGGEQVVTLKNFLGHLFYALRKRGFTSYPMETEFELSYEHSGLYDCLEFNVPPDGSVTVQVVKKGWALKQRDRILPIKKAQIRRAD